MPKGSDDPLGRGDLRRGARLRTSYASAVTSVINTEDRRLAVMCALVAAAMLQNPEGAEDVERHPLLTAGELVLTQIESRDRLVWQAAGDRHPDSVDLTDLELDEAVEAIRRQTDASYRSARCEFLSIVADLDKKGVEYWRTARADEIYVRGSMKRVAIDRDPKDSYVVTNAPNELDRDELT